MKEKFSGINLTQVSFDQDMFQTLMQNRKFIPIQQLAQTAIAPLNSDFVTVGIIAIINQKTSQKSNQYFSIQLEDDNRKYIRLCAFKGAFSAIEKKSLQKGDVIAILNPQQHHVNFQLTTYNIDEEEQFLVLGKGEIKNKQFEKREKQQLTPLLYDFQTKYDKKRLNAKAQNKGVITGRMELLGDMGIIKKKCKLEDKIPKQPSKKKQIFIKGLSDKQIGQVSLIIREEWLKKIKQPKDKGIKIAVNQK